MNRKGVLFAGIIIHLCALLMGMAEGQNRDVNVTRCDGSDWDLRIAGCTALIQSGKGGTEFANFETTSLASIGGESLLPKLRMAIRNIWATAVLGCFDVTVP